MLNRNFGYGMMVLRNRRLKMLMTTLIYPNAQTSFKEKMAHHTAAVGMENHLSLQLFDICLAEILVSLSIITRRKLVVDTYGFSTDIRRITMQGRGILSRVQV